MPNLRNGSKGHSNPGSFDCESGILPLSYRAPQKLYVLSCDKKVHRTDAFQLTLKLLGLLKDKGVGYTNDQRQQSDIKQGRGGNYQKVGVLWTLAPPVGKDGIISDHSRCFSHTH